jgi:hypothetical protein
MKASEVTGENKPWWYTERKRAARKFRFKEWLREQRNYVRVNLGLRRR